MSLHGVVSLRQAMGWPWVHWGGPMGPEVYAVQPTGAGRPSCMRGERQEEGIVGVLGWSINI